MLEECDVTAKTVALQHRRARSVLHPVPAGAPRSTRTSAAPRALRVPRRQSSRERCGAARMRPTRLQRRCRREKLGARGEERPFPQRHHDGGHQVQWSTVPQRVARQAYKNSRQQMPRASSGARREFSTLYPLFQLFSLRSHRGVGSDFQFLQIINNIHIFRVPWHRVPLVDFKITKLHAPLFNVKLYTHKSLPLAV